MADAEPNTPAATLTTQLDELDTHLDSLIATPDPSHHFNAALFDRISYQLGPVAYPDLTARFLPRLGHILKQTAEAAEQPSSPDQHPSKGYPQPLITLTIKLLRPLSFTEALELCQPPYLLTALASPEEYINALGLAILQKATASPSDASILAAAPRLLEALLARWLTSPAVAVGHQGVSLIGDLLDIDCPIAQPVFTDEQKECLDIRLIPRTAQGHGTVWRRLFSGPDGGLCWAMLQKLDSELLPAVSEDPKIVAAQRSFAQDRLLRLLPRLAVLDSHTITVSTAPLGPDGRNVSLLEFATLYMVDREGDVLMRLAWVDYMMKLVGALRVADTARLNGDIVRRLVREASDPELVEALWGMVDNLVWTPMGEADDMRAWLREVAPRPALMVSDIER